MAKIKQLVFLFVVIFLISGCAPQNSAALKTPTPGEDQVDNETRPVVTSTPTQVALGTDENELDGKQIHFLHPWSGKIASELALMVDQFNQTNEWSIHVIMDSPGSAGMAAQAMWEGIEEEIPANVIAAPIDLLLAVDEKTDLVADLEPYISSKRYGMSPAQRKDFSPVFWEEDYAAGKQYAIPAQRTAAVMIYNSTWARELGYNQAPSTPDEFQQQVCAANAVQRQDTDVTNDGIGGWIINTSSPVLLNWLDAFNADVFSDPTVTFASAETDDAFSFLFGLYRKSCAWTGKVPQPYEYFARRQALVYSGQMQDIAMQTNFMQRMDSKDEWQVIPFPGLERRATVTSGFSYAILQADAAKDLAAWLFIRWMSEPVQQARLLKVSGTLPLGQQVMSQMADYAQANPQWKQAVETLKDPVIQPKTSDWTVIAPVLEDAGWQIFNSETKLEQIPAVIEQMDDLVKELSERYP